MTGGWMGENGLELAPGETETLIATGRIMRDHVSFKLGDWALKGQ